MGVMAQFEGQLQTMKVHPCVMSAPTCAFWLLGDVSVILWLFSGFSLVVAPKLQTMEGKGSGVAPE